MRKNTMKAAVLAAVAGTVLQVGCLGPILQQALLEVVAEQVANLVPFDLGGLLGGDTAGA